MAAKKFNKPVIPVTNEVGQGLTEYALIIVLIAVALVGALTTLNGSLTSVYTAVAGMFP